MSNIGDAVARQRLTVSAARRSDGRQSAGHGRWRAASSVTAATSSACVTLYWCSSLVVPWTKISSAASVSASSSSQRLAVLGHAGVATTDRYITTNLQMKRDAMQAF